MSELEFVAAIVRALAWPTALLAVVLLLRSAIVELLGREGLRRLKAGPLEAEWERELIRTEAQLDIASRGEIPATDTQSKLSEELIEVARQTPSTAVLEAYDHIERELRQVLEKAQIPGAERLGGSRLAHLAAEHNLISPADAHAVEGVTVLRNLAAHGRGDVSEQRALEYLTLVDAVLYALRHDRLPAPNEQVPQ